MDDIPFGDAITKHLLYHVWPTKRSDVWEWNLSRLKKSIEQFNGRRIVSIAKSPDAHKPEAVMNELKGLDCEFVIGKNNKRLGEVVNFAKMLGRVQSLDPNEVVFYGHAKGVKHKSLKDSHPIMRWTSAMYETVLENWDGAKRILQSKAIAGSFRRHGQFAIPHNHRWHYSGTFYWFRSCHVFNRNWQAVDRVYFGTEAWPGRLVPVEDSGCLFLDHAGGLYLEKYWHETVEPELEKWRNRNLLSKL